MINLKDMIDLQSWQEIQDNFAKILPCEITTVNLYGQEIAISKKNSKFNELIRNNKLAELKNKGKIQEQLYDVQDQIIFYYHPNNMINVLVPIVIEGNCVGAIKGGPIAERRINVPIFSKFAKEIKADAKELTSAYNELKQLKEDEIKSIGMLLLTLARIMPKITMEKQKDTRSISELTILTKINNMINETLDLNKVLNSITNFMIDSIKEEKNCCVFILNKNNNLEMKSSAGEIKFFNHEELLIQKTITGQAIANKSIIIVKNISNEFDKEDVRFNCVVAIPLKIRENLVGSINLTGDTFRISEKDLDFLNIIATQTAIAIENSRLYEETKKKAITDPLTNLYNRDYFMETFKRELIRTEKSQKPISFMILDLDDFKHYNDTNGHIAGDVLLKEFSDVLIQNVRKTDIVGRFGGEEFIILLPETPNNEALDVATKIKEDVEIYNFKHKEKQPLNKVTVSVGLVTCIQSKFDEKQIINRADKLLYKAKNTGKNKVVNKVIFNDKDYEV